MKQTQTTPKRRTPKAPRRQVNKALGQLEDAQLVHRLIEEEHAYIFKHALTQEAAANSILKTRRTELHRQVARTYEQLYADRLDEMAALLAQHFEQAEEPHRALDYLQHAAEWSRRKNAHREEAALLARAIRLAEQTTRKDLLADLHARRGKALANLNQWQEAKQDLETALALLPPTDLEHRTRVLLELAQVTTWLWDMARALEYTQEALHLAQQLGKDELIATAMSQLAAGELSDARTREAIAHFDQAFARAPAMHQSELIHMLAFAGLAHYWVGDFQPAIELCRQAITRAHEMYDNGTIVFSQANLALGLMGSGAYAEAFQTFYEACDFARKHDVKAFLSRALAMLGGLHLDLFDYAGAERIAQEARQVGRAANFSPAVVSAGIDLMLNYARRGEIQLAARLIPEIAGVLPKTYGNHRWIWELRFAQARAELALAKQAWDDVLHFTESVLVQSATTSRIKYTVVGNLTRAHALVAVGRETEARALFDTAVNLARPTGDPLLFVRTAMARLGFEADDALANEARGIAQRISSALPPNTLRWRFEAIVSEWL